MPVTEDLTALSGYLLQEGVIHRITEEMGKQVIWVDRKEAVEPLLQLLNSIQSGRTRIVSKDQPSQAEEAATTAWVRDLEAHFSPPPLKYWLQIKQAVLNSPVVFALLLLSAVGYNIVHWKAFSGILPLLTFQGFPNLTSSEYFIPLSQSLKEGEIWRLLTPAFLHFSLLHVIFNSVLLWAFGAKVERLLGSGCFALLFIFIAIFSHFCQFFWHLSEPSIFGGMSGVVYGLVGVIWVRQWLAPAKALAIPPGIVPVMLVWMFICMIDELQWLVQVRVANAVHVGGLVAGMLCGLLWGLKAKAAHNPVSP